jgi:hypothetical protein
MRAFNAGDAKGAAEIYDPDGRKYFNNVIELNPFLGYFMPNGHSPVKGRNGIEKFFQKDMAEGVASAQVN